MNAHRGPPTVGRRGLLQLLGEFSIAGSSLVQHLYAEVANQKVVGPVARVP
jgi:hypothetical protein